ncbi:hypothetical protein P7C73_g893, partial [Tremellales sp. Uapishka_1]
MPSVPHKRARARSVDRTYNRSCQDGDADFLLISSDNEVFKVHTYVLKAASSVLKDTLTIVTAPQPTDATLPEVRLTDTLIESRQIVKLFLDILYDRPFLDPATAKQGRTLPSVLSLLKKYDCSKDLRMMGLRLRALMDVRKSGIDPMRVFAAAAQVDDVETCICAIRKQGSNVWKADVKEGREMEMGLKGGAVFDLTAAPLFYFEIVPARYLAALARASREKNTGSRKADWEKVADEFGRLLGHPRVYSSHHLIHYCGAHYSLLLDSQNHSEIHLTTESPSLLYLFVLYNLACLLVDLWLFE